MFLKLMSLTLKSAQMLLSGVHVTRRMCSKTCLKRPLKKKTKIGFKDRLSLNAGQKYCRMLPPKEHSAILSTFIKLPFVIKTFILFRQVLLYIC